jgi:hypothetical protein
MSMKTSMTATKKQRRKPASPIAFLARLVGLEHEDVPQRGSALRPHS